MHVLQRAHRRFPVPIPTRFVTSRAVRASIEAPWMFVSGPLHQRKISVNARSNFLIYHLPPNVPRRAQDELPTKRATVVVPAPSWASLLSPWGWTKYFFPESAAIHSGRG